MRIVNDSSYDHHHRSVNDCNGLAAGEQALTTEPFAEKMPSDRSVLGGGSVKMMDGLEGRVRGVS